MKKILNILFYIILLSSLIIFINSGTYITFGSIAFKILIIMMFSRPLRDIFSKKLGFLDKIVRIRKELGIIVGVFAIAHTIGYFINFNSNIGIFFSSNLWYLDSFLMWGFLAFIVTIPLLLTSNIFSVIKLGKYWKKLQYLAYLMFIFTVLHVAFIKEDALIPNIILLIIYLFILFYSGYLNKKNLKNSTSIKYVCIPCGWIYDEEIGDPDSGIAPGTKFEDIPDSWVCPVCFVGKKDFKKITGDNIEEEIFLTQIIKINKINKNNDVIELILEYKNEIDIKVGQFVTFILKDINGDFKRSYSVSNKNGNKLTFLIKILENGRAGNIFKILKKGDSINTTKAFGNFELINNSNKKLFIATGTGLAPIYNMINSLKPEENKLLLFGVKDLNDIFYIDKLSKIEKLKINIFLSREENIPENQENIKYFNSRIDLSKIENIDNYEDFYLCGNPPMIESCSIFLRNKGKNNIYFEQF